MKIDPQEYVYQGFPPIMPKKLQKHRYRARLLPSTIYKNSKNIEQTLFLCAKIKSRTLSKNVKIDPQEYVYQGFPPIMPKKLQKHRNELGYYPLPSTRTPKILNELCFYGRKLKREN